MKRRLLIADAQTLMRDALHALRAAPRSRLLVLTAQEGENAVWAALQAGADGYVLKESSRQELLTAIETVLRGERFITPAVSAQIVGRYLQGRSAPPPA